MLDTRCWIVIANSKNLRIYGEMSIFIGESGKPIYEPTTADHPFYNVTWTASSQSLPWYITVVSPSM